MSSPYDELNNPKIKEEYFYGVKNQAIRVYYYLKEGLDLFNDFKYLVAGILAVFYLLNLEGYQYMLLMGLISLPFLIVIGYLWTHKAKKTIEYFNLKFTTYFSQYNMRVQERQLELLEEISEKLSKLEHK